MENEKVVPECRTAAAAAPNRNREFRCVFLLKIPAGGKKEGAVIPQRTDNFSFFFFSVGR